MSFPDTELADAFRRLMPRPVRTPRLMRVVDVPFVLGARGTPLQGGELVFVRLGLNGTATVLNWSMAATIAGRAASGSCTIDVLAGATLGTVSSICGGHPPRLAAQAELDEQPPTNWSSSLNDPIWLEAFVTSVDGVLELVGLTLRLAVGIDPTGNVVTDASGAAVFDNSGNLVTPG